MEEKEEEFKEFFVKTWKVPGLDSKNDNRKVNKRKRKRKSLKIFLSKL